MNTLQKLLDAFTLKDYSRLTLSDLRELVACKLINPKTAARIAAQI